MATIDRFRGEYSFLSNMHICFRSNIVALGYSFNSVEVPFQAYKCKNKADIAQFVDLRPVDAKALGKQILLRDDWEEIKDMVMYDLVFQKYSKSPLLKNKLLATGNTVLIEGNTWGDTYWGVCNGKGSNKLGQITMDVRDELRG